MDRVFIQWTDTAKNGLARLPQGVRRGLLEKVNGLREADSIKAVQKLLVGPLSGYFRISELRYRAIYSMETEPIPNGDVLVKIIIQFVSAGTRKEDDKDEIYRLARKLAELGAIEVFGNDPSHPC